tara:strand:- start:2226 stop:3422 length:1197 start_codon:yes stop_codon:yes gene_type:complete
VKNIKETVQNLATQVLDEVISHRRHFHQNPELSFEEFETSKYIQNWLTENGISFKSGFVKTGIVAEIKGNLPSDKVLALRTDMDALPIHETNDFDFKSKNDGVMHACGHDVHSASIMGTILILNQLKDHFGGTIKFIFQPGEEKLPGGAKLMIEEGALDNPTPNGILGQHVYPDLPAGKVGFRSGMYMASADEIYITVTGKGGHAALPERLVDPILISSHLVVALQQIVSRRNNPKTPSVVSIGHIEGIGATNVIPNQVHLKGTFRTFDEDWRFEAHKLMKNLAKGLVEGMGGEVDFDIHVGYPSVYNNPELSDRNQQHAIDFLGKDNVVDLDLRMTAEDFSWYSQKFPGCFYRLGTAPQSGEYFGLHTPNFNVDEAALETGIGLMSYLAIQELNNEL